MEEAGMCGVNHLDADARLPPRKRLLAGMKKQNSDASSPSSSPAHTVTTDITKRLRDLFSTDSNGSNLSTDQIVEASRSAALAASQVAAAAKARAQEKAAVAAKAVAAVKTALEFVAWFSVKKSRKERASKKDKPKKHIPVKLLYKKRKRGHKGETDEELARKLHQVINSSPRILKNSTTSDQKVDNHKKRRKRLVFEKTALSNGRLPLDVTQSSLNDMNSEAGTSVQRETMVELDDKASKRPKADNSEMISVLANGEPETNHSAVQGLEDTVSTGRKRGRIKQKKLSLSLCTVRDRQNTKEEPKFRGLKPVKESKDNPSTAIDPELTVEPSGAVVLHEAVSTWKHKEFSAPQCYAGSNILGSLCSNPTVTTGSAMVEVDK